MTVQPTLTITAAALLVLAAVSGTAQTLAAGTEQLYEHEETRAIVTLVDDAAALVRSRGDAAFADLRVAGGRWRNGESYVFVLDPDGNMLVHADPAMEGTNQLSLTDVAGKPIVRGLIETATTLPEKPTGWYHYQWPVPGGLLPRWKSSYVRLVEAPSGQRFVVGSGVYNDRMERAFVVDMVEDAVGRIEQEGEAAYPRLFDPAGRFLAKDAYVWVISSEGVDVANPAFPNLTGRNQLDLKDTQGKPLIRDMLDVVRTRGSGWVDYMWPKPGESLSTRKSTYVSKARIGGEWVMVGCGVYLASAPRAKTAVGRMTAPELMTLVREGAALLAERGEDAYPEFRQKGSRWSRDDTYFMAVTMDGMTAFHAADPAQEGRKHSDLVDVLGRPFGRMFLEAAASPSGEGWVHYMYPEPGNIFPTWKSVFVKRVTFPSGRQHVLCSGIYNMQMDEAFIEDVVDRAARLVAARGRNAFDELRDRRGPFVFMDTYVFVDRPDGVEVVNPAQPSLEGTNLLGQKDLNGKALVDEYLAAAMKHGSAWVEYYWYKPGHNTPAPKRAYVRKVQSGPDTYIVGSGYYVDEEAAVTDEPYDDPLTEGTIRQPSEAHMSTQYLQQSTPQQLAAPGHAAPGESPAQQTHRVLTPADLEWKPDALDPRRTAAALVGDPTRPGPYTMRFRAPAGYEIGLHQHPDDDEQLTVLAGRIRWSTGEAGSGVPEHELTAGGFAAAPRGVPHRITVVEDSILQMSGIGPRTYVYLDPADDPRQKH